MKKVPASEATRKRLEEVFSGEQIDPSRVVREAARLMIEQVLEAEVEDAVGRQYYAHGRAAGDEPRPLRNGVRRGRIDSAEGVIEFNAPQVRGLSGWTSEVRLALAGRSEELTRLAVEMYARGLSVRDIEATFTDETGRCVLTKSAADAGSPGLAQRRRHLIRGQTDPEPARSSQRRIRAATCIAAQEHVPLTNSQHTWDLTPSTGPRPARDWRVLPALRRCGVQRAAKNGGQKLPQRDDDQPLVRGLASHHYPGHHRECRRLVPATGDSSWRGQARRRRRSSVGSRAVRPRGERPAPLRPPTRQRG